MSIYGDIITGDVVRNGVISHLRAWMPAYIAEVARQRSRLDVVSPIKTWAARVDFATLTGDQTPVLVVVAPGLTDKPRRRGDGTYEVDWAVGVGVLAMADTEEHTMALAELYTGAARAAMLQHRSLSGLAINTSWEDERYDDRSGLNMRPDDVRTIAAGQAMFIVTIADALNVYDGPVTPPANVGIEPPQWPTAETIKIQVERSA